MVHDEGALVASYVIPGGVAMPAPSAHLLTHCYCPQLAKIYEKIRPPSPTGGPKFACAAKQVTVFAVGSGDWKRIAKIGMANSEVNP